MDKCFDVVIIGAGPSGSMAAKESARLGLRSVLIEKEKIPRAKPCGGGVSLKALNLIGSRIPDNLIERYVKGFRFFDPSLNSVEFISEDPIGISTTRDRFDAFLTEQAINQGCEFVDSDKVIDVCILSDRVICRLQSGKLIEGCIVIGADGANSITARKVGIRKQWRSDEVGLCLETTLFLDKEKVRRIDPEIFELYFINIPLGYGWLFPKRSSISLGIGGCLVDLYQPKKILMDFCATVARLKKIDLKISEFRAHLVPAGGFKRGIVSDRVMLVGDAAGFIDPLIGEGIYYAMKSGLQAASAARKAIEENDFSSFSLEKHYAKVCEEMFGKDLKTALWLTYKIHNHFDTFFSFLRSYSGTSWADLARGKITYRVLKRKALPLLVVWFISRKIQGVFHIERRK